MPESWRMEYFTATRLATRCWERMEMMYGIDKGLRWCVGRGERILWAALFFPLGVWCGYSGFGIQKRTNREGPTLHHLTDLSSRKIVGKDIQQTRTPVQLSFVRSPPLLGCRHWQGTARKHLVKDQQAPSWEWKIHDDGGVALLHQKLYTQSLWFCISVTSGVDGWYLGEIENHTRLHGSKISIMV